VSTRAVGSTVTALIVLLAAALGAWPLAIVTIMLAGVVLADLGDALGQAAQRPVLLAAAVPGLVLPAVVAATDVDGWAAIADFFAVMLLGAFGLIIVFGRRVGVTAAVGATALVGLVAGLGAVSLLLLRELPDGFRWVAGVAALIVAAELGAPAGRALAGRLRARRGDEDHRRPDDEPAPGPGLALAAVFLIIGGGVLVALWSPPFGPPAAAAVGAAVFVVRVLTDELGAALLTEARGRGQAGMALGMILLTAPVAYVLARSAVI
jgi:hypothetical protein